MIKILIILTPGSIIKNKKSINFLNFSKNLSMKNKKLFIQEKIKTLFISLSNYKSVWISQKITLINRLQKENKNNSMNMIKSLVFLNQPNQKFRKNKKNDKISRNLKINFFILSVVVIFISKLRLKNFQFKRKIKNRHKVKYHIKKVKEIY